MRIPIRTHDRAAGFTLAEVAVTLVIVAITLTLVLQALTNAKLTAANTRNIKLARDLGLLTLGQVEAGLLQDEIRDFYSGSYAEEGYYGDAMVILAMLEKSFKGMEVGDKAKETKRAWKKDKKIKAELEAAAFVDQASFLVRQRRFKQAYALLRKVLRTKKYADTKAHGRASDKLKEIQPFL